VDLLVAACEQGSGVAKTACSSWVNRDLVPWQDRLLNMLRLYSTARAIAGCNQVNIRLFDLRVPLLTQHLFTRQAVVVAGMPCISRYGLFSITVTNVIAFQLVLCSCMCRHSKFPARTARGCSPGHMKRNMASKARSPRAVQHASTSSFACPALASSPKPECIPMPTTGLLSRCRSRSPPKDAFAVSPARFHVQPVVA